MYYYLVCMHCLRFASRERFMGFWSFALTVGGMGFGMVCSACVPVWVRVCVLFI